MNDDRISCGVGTQYASMALLNRLGSIDKDHCPGV